MKPYFSFTWLRSNVPVGWNVRERLKKPPAKSLYKRSTFPSQLPSSWKKKRSYTQRITLAITLQIYIEIHVKAAMIAEWEIFTSFPLLLHLDDRLIELFSVMTFWMDKSSRCWFLPFVHGVTDDLMAGFKWLLEISPVTHWHLTRTWIYQRFLFDFIQQFLFSLGKQIEPGCRSAFIDFSFNFENKHNRLWLDISSYDYSGGGLIQFKLNESPETMNLTELTEDSNELGLDSIKNSSFSIIGKKRCEFFKLMEIDIIAPFRP